MEHKVYNVLFICTGNAARSIMAEALLRHLGEGRFNVYSGGTQPRGVVHPLTFKTLESLGLPTSGFQSKSSAQFARPDAQKMDFAFTVCDQAAGEPCPVLPGQPATAHWGVPDPTAVEGSEEEKAKAFHDAAMVLKRRIEFFVALPIEKLDHLSLTKEVEDIGRTR